MISILAKFCSLALIVIFIIGIFVAKDLEVISIKVTGLIFVVMISIFI